jgi:RNA polymerase sigma factor (TIGR02999 family)
MDAIGHSHRKEFGRGGARGMLPAQFEQLIQSAEQGDVSSRKRLFALLYDELHRLAERELRRSPSLTLSPTTLLHETYLNLSSGNGAVFPDRARFLAYASRAMRGLLIDYVRSRRAQKRGAAFEITCLPTEVPAGDAADDSLEEIGEALNTLGAVEPRLAQLVDLKFFCGCSFAEIAGLLGVSERTAKRDWDKARLLLRDYLDDRTAPSSGEADPAV